MPRKVKTPASVAQNRDSQRRSRARQRELVDGMRRQLQEYEHRSVEASLEMQRAAQQVGWENRRLRMLLQGRGVSPDEIEAFLHLPDGAFVAVVAQKDSSPGSIPDQSVTTMPGLASHSLETVSFPLQRCIPNQTVVNEPGRDVSPLNGTSHSRHGALDSPPATPMLEGQRDFVMTPLETPCVVAADIIAGFCGHQDAAEALVTLGCAGAKDCLVRNERIFQLMDNAI